MSSLSRIKVIPGSDCNARDFLWKNRPNKPSNENEENPPTSDPSGFETCGYNHVDIKSVCIILKDALIKVLESAPATIRKQIINRYPEIVLYGYPAPAQKIGASKVKFKGENRITMGVGFPVEEVRTASASVLNCCGHECAHHCTNDALGHHISDEAFAIRIDEELFPIPPDEITKITRMKIWDSDSFVATTGLMLPPTHSHVPYLEEYAFSLYLTAANTLRHQTLGEVWRVIGDLMAISHKQGFQVHQDQIEEVISNVFDNSREVLQSKVFHPLTPGNHQFIFPYAVEPKFVATSFNVRRESNGNLECKGINVENAPQTLRLFNQGRGSTSVNFSPKSNASFKVLADRIVGATINGSVVKSIDEVAEIIQDTGFFIVSMTKDEITIRRR